MNQQLIDLGGKLEAKRSEWGAFYQGFNAVGDAQAKTMTGEDVAKFKAFESEVADLQKQYDSLKGIADAQEDNAKRLEAGYRVEGKQAPGAPQAKTITQQIRAKGGLMALKGAGVELDVDAAQWMMQAKATMTTGANGFPPQVLRDGNVVPIIQRPPQLIDFLRIEPTDQNSIKFMAQTVRTNAAAAKSEGSALDEATITYAEQTDIISRVGVWIPVTEEQLADEPGIRTLVEMDLAGMVREQLDTDLTVGSGVDPILLGIYTGAGQTQAKGADPVFDAIHKAITKGRVTGRVRPNLVVLHANDWQDICLTRTTDGVYILGNPTDGAPLRIWGLPVALSEALTENSGLVLDTDYYRVKMRQGVTIAVSDSHASNFIANTLVLRAHVRAGIMHMRTYASVKVTGI